MSYIEHDGRLTWVPPKVPFPVGTRVRFKRGSDAHDYTVYDHHGVTWEEGTETSRVVVVRGYDADEIQADPDPALAAHCGIVMRVTTWGRLVSAEDDGAPGAGIAVVSEPVGSQAV